MRFLMTGMMILFAVAFVCCGSAMAAPQAGKGEKGEKSSKVGKEEKVAQNPVQKGIQKGIPKVIPKEGSDRKGPKTSRPLQQAQPTKEKSDKKPCFDDDAYTYDQAKNWVKTEKGYKNPFKPGSYKHFLASKGYPKTYDFWKDKKALGKASPKDTSLVLLLGCQRGILYAKGVPVLDFPISTGKENYATPSGEFVILEKDEKHVSNLYGTIRNSSGKKLHSDAKAGRDKVPQGAAFKGAPMPFFMRLTYTGIGIHVGKVRRVPSSHGCIRVLPETCKLIYHKVKEGTPVSILP